MEIREDLLPYHDRLEARDVRILELVVLHCTELPALSDAREYGERIVHPESQTGNSGHYYIDRDGSVYRYVREDRVAHHVIGHNENSLGIEIVNTGRYPNWFFEKSQVVTEAYTGPQIRALRELLAHLRQAFPSLARIARHSDLDTTLVPAEDNPAAKIRRKIDPGPLFPWQEIADYWQDLCNAPRSR